MAEQTDRKERMDKLTEMLENGVKEVFSDGRYAEWLKTMSQFHHYSFRNQMLIHLQKPEATYVAGFNKWKSLGRSINKGEHGIQILAPAPYKRTVTVTHDENGIPLPEPREQEITCMAFKPAFVFDISQTNGRELPELAQLLEGEVKDFDIIFKALKLHSPYPISFEPIEGGANGYCSHLEQKIVIREGVSQEQAVKTAVHEIAHGIMHTPDKERDRRAFEVQAESVAYIVCRHLGIDTSQYSFGYVAGWAADQDLKVLQNSLVDIQQAADELITHLDPEIERQRELTMTKDEQLFPDKMFLLKERPVTQAAELTMNSDALAKQMARNGFEQMESKGRLSDFLVFRDTEINDFLTFYDWNMVAKFASEHKTVTADSRDIRVEGLTGSWQTVDSLKVCGREYFMLQHEQHGESFPNVIVDSKGYPMTGLTLEGWDELRENIKSLDANWNHETNDLESVDYRDSLTPGERKLAMIWDEKYDKGIQNVCEDILRAESESEIPEPQPKRIADRLKEKKAECERINASRTAPERMNRNITR